LFPPPPAQLIEQKLEGRLATFPLGLKDKGARGPLILKERKGGKQAKRGIKDIRQRPKGSFIL